MKYYSYRNLLFICACLIAFSCKDDEFDNVSQNEESTYVHIDALGRTIETVNTKSIPFLIDHIARERAGYLPSDGNRTQDEESNPFGTINLDHIRALINDEGAIDKTYTFAMINPPHITDEFSNLIVRVIDGEIIRAYINVYAPTPGYLADFGISVGSTFSGTISSYSLEGSGIDLNRSTVSKLGEGLTPIKMKSLDEGFTTGVTITNDCDPPETNNDSPDAPPDSGDDGLPGGGSGDHGEPDTSDHQDTGTNDHDPSGGGTGSDGGGGDTSDCDFEIYVGCCNRNICVPHGPRLPEPLCTGSNAVVIDCSDDRSANTTGDEVNTDYIDCPNDDVVVIEPSSIEELCEEILAQNNDPEFQEKVNMVNSEQALGETSEAGFGQLVEGNYTPPLPVLDDGTVDLPPTGINGLLGLIHNHPDLLEDENGELYEGYNIFSDVDIFIFLYSIYQADINDLPLESAYSSVYSSDNDYTLRFNGHGEDVFDYLNDILPGLFENRNSLIEAYVNAMEDENGEEDLETGLLKFMRETILLPPDFGVQLFRYNEDGSVTHLSLDENDELIETDC